MIHKAKKSLGAAIACTLLSQAALAAAPTKPVIAWLPATFESGSNINVRWDMWWGVNGDAWNLTDGTSGICSGSLAVNGSNAQYASCSVDLASGAHTLVVSLCNTDGCTSSDAKTFTVAGGSANAAPTVDLQAPASASTGSDVTLTASAADSDGSIASVSFYQGATLLGTDTSAPYSAIYSATSAGSFSLSAIATDDLGATATASSTLVVSDPACTNCNAAPTVSLTAPASANAGDSVAISAAAADSDGTIARVEFRLDGALLSTDTSAPYSASWSATAGSHILTAVATDDAGASTESAATNIVVNGTQNSTLTQPAAPTINWLGDQTSTTFTVGWNSWWGENGTVWKVKDNGSVVYTASVAANSPNAQSASAAITVGGSGQRSLVVELCNSDASGELCTASAAVVINVGDAEDPCTTDCSTGTSPWDYLDNSEWVARKNSGPGAFNVTHTNTSNKLVGAYFVEWGIYGRAFYPKDIPVENLNHIFYGFIPVCGPNSSLTGTAKSALDAQCAGKPDYTVVVHDKFAALEKNDLDSTGKWDDEVKGIFAEMYRLKMTYPEVKIIPSVGGWTLSDPLFDIGTQAGPRAVFIDSIIAFIDKYDFFDGIDIDWEFPGGGGANPALGSSADGEGFATLMVELRAALDQLEVKNNRQYELTAAMSGGVQKLSEVNWEKAAPAMDFINLMTYDYYGAWSNTYGHQTGVYDSADALTPIDGYNINDAVSYLMTRGVPSTKLTAGVAMYGRGWEGISGGDQSGPYGATGGAPITGTQQEGFWEAGIMDYKGLETAMMGGANGQGINGYTLFWDDIAKASFLWNATAGKFITFDTQRSVKAKGAYVLQHNMGGLFAWEIDADNGHLLNAMHEGLGHPQQ